MPFSQIIPSSPSPTESTRLFYTSVSLLLSHIQGYCYHLSEFHIYVLVYCIVVFLSGFKRINIYLVRIGHSLIRPNTVSSINKFNSNITLLSRMFSDSLVIIIPSYFYLPLLLSFFPF